MTSGSEYEYEYDKLATETFLVDIDVTTVNKDAKDLHQQVVNSYTQKRPNPFDTTEEQRPDEVDDRADEGPQPTAGPTSSKGKAQNNQESASEVQILGLESDNPIVLYDNQLYSCRWTDLIGTNMFFSNHVEDAEQEPVSSDGDIDLVGLSRIKLLANSARLTAKEDPKKRSRDDADSVAGEAEEEDERALQPRAGSGLGALRSTNPKINIELKKQAHFLERLIDVKRARGETDPVRTLYEPKRGRPQKKQAQEKKSQEELKADISRLNKSVLQGDPDALSRLQEIYEQLDDQEASNKSVASTHILPTNPSQPSVSSQKALSLQTET